MGPTLLLHPLDFLGPDDAPELQFFPGMELSAATKIKRVGRFVDRLTAEFDIGPVGRYARNVAANSPRTRSLRA